MSKHADIGVLGGGVIGSTIALRLAAAGLSTSLFEKLPELGGGASKAAIGGITPVSDDYCRSELKPLAKWSTQRYKTWVGQVSGDSGIEVPYLESGLLYVALTARDWKYLVNEFLPEVSSLDIDYSVLSAAEVREKEPLLSHQILGAIHIPIEGAVEPAPLMRAVSQLLHQSNKVNLITNCRIELIKEHSLGVTVATSEGSFEFERVVVCLGMGSADLFPTLKERLLGVRGQALELRANEALGYALNHHIYAHIDNEDKPLVSTYFVPRSDGRVALGVTYEPTEEIILNTALGINKILEAGFKIVPSSKDWQFCRVWSGIRPGTVDGRPIIGFWEDSERIVMATGHFGLGITLAPVTAQIVAEIIGISPPEIIRTLQPGTYRVTAAKIDPISDK